MGGADAVAGQEHDRSRVLKSRRCRLISRISRLPGSSFGWTLPPEPPGRTARPRPAAGGRGRRTGDPDPADAQGDLPLQPGGRVAAVEDLRDPAVPLGIGGDAGIQEDGRDPPGDVAFQAVKPGPGPGHHAPRWEPPSWPEGPGGGRRDSRGASVRLPAASDLPEEPLAADEGHRHERQLRVGGGPGLVSRVARPVEAGGMTDGPGGGRPIRTRGIRGPSPLTAGRHERLFGQATPAGDPAGVGRPTRP